MRMLAVTLFAASWLKSLHPTHPAYAAFKTELANLRKLAADTAQMPILPGKRLKLGQPDDRLPILRQHLQRLGHLNRNARSFRPPTSHSGTCPQRRQHWPHIHGRGCEQCAQGLSESPQSQADRHPGQLTIRALNNQSPARNIAGLTANMERLRWLPRELGKRHVFVNQAAFEVRVMDGQREVWRSNVVVGKTDAQTSAFHDVMELVVFNPSWGVPPSIVSNEMLPILWRDPTYLDRKGFTVVNKSGKRVASSDVNWAAYGANAPYSIMQPPGEDNALGEVKFLFPNRHHIYMHDTPSRQLFSRPVRAFSHGCVRVQNPRRFAEIVLGLSPAEVARRMEGAARQCG